MAEERKTPGEVLGKSHEFVAGPGTYLNSCNNTIYASVVGQKRLIPASPEAHDKRPTVEVVRGKKPAPVPEPGAIVTAKFDAYTKTVIAWKLNAYPVKSNVSKLITKVLPRRAIADIVSVGRKAVKEKFSGFVRQQDVRATEIDKVDMYESFRPGDIIQAEVLSLGDARAYQLSTAKNELGVVHATSLSGVQMIAIDWDKMQCPLTGQIEKRKVAKLS